MKNTNLDFYQELTKCKTIRNNFIESKVDFIQSNNEIHAKFFS